MSTHELIREAVVVAFNEMIVGSQPQVSIDIYNFISNFRNTFQYYLTNNVRVKDDVWVDLRKSNNLLHSFMGASTVFGLVTADQSNQVVKTLAQALRVFTAHSEIVIDEELAKCPGEQMHTVNLQENLWYQFLVAASFNLSALTVPKPTKVKPDAKG